MVSRGDIWWVEHPELGRRPFLVLTRHEAIPVLNQVVAANVTTTIRGIPTEVELGATDGLPAPCVVALDALNQVRPALCTERIATLGPERMAEVGEALRAALAC
jgi:mRNA interferase MazF